MNDLADFLKKLQTSQSSVTARGEQSNEGKILNLCSGANRGTAAIRIIKDELGEYMRVMNYVFEVYEESQAKNPDGTLKVGKDGKPWMNYSYYVIPNPDPKYGNYCSNLLKLNPEQYQMASDLYEALRMYDNMVQQKIIDPNQTETKLSVKFRKQYYLFWGKVISLSNQQGQSLLKQPEVRLLKHISNSFGTNLSTTINARTSALQDGGKWFANYCDRTPGTQNHIMSLTTDLNNGIVGYSALFQFLDGASYELTDADIAYCTDLNAQVADVTRFDRDFYSSLTQRIVAELTKANEIQQQKLGLTPVASPVASVDQSQLASVTPTVQDQMNVNPANVYPAQGVAPAVEPAAMTGGIPTTANTIPNNVAPQQPVYAPAGFSMPTTNL